MILGIILHHMGSKRLPGKALLPLAGKPTLEIYIERTKQSRLIDKLVFATGDLKENDVLCDIAEKTGIASFKGSEHDVLDRMYQCAKHFNADTIVRLTADNLLIEPKEIDLIIQRFIDLRCIDIQFASNVDNWMDSGYPDGLGAEVYRINLLEKMYREIKQGNKIREHPHLYPRKNKDKVLSTVPEWHGDKKYSHLVFTIDTKEDYKFIDDIYNKYNINCRFKDYKDYVLSKR